MDLSMISSASSISSSSSSRRRRRWTSSKVMMMMIGLFSIMMSPVAYGWMNIKHPHHHLSSSPFSPSSRRRSISQPCSSPLHRSSTRLYIFGDDDEREDSDDYLTRQKKKEQEEREKTYAVVQWEQEKITGADGNDEMTSKPRIQVQPQFSAFEDLYPVMASWVKNVVELDNEGTARRSAQMTILSVAAMGLGTIILFFSLLPQGFIHNPTDAKTVASRPTYKTKTYIDPEKVLEDDFYRAGGVYMYDWNNQQVDDDDF